MGGQDERLIRQYVQGKFAETMGRAAEAARKATTPEQVSDIQRTLFKEIRKQAPKVVKELEGALSEAYKAPGKGEKGISKDVAMRMIKRKAERQIDNVASGIQRLVQEGAVDTGGERLGGAKEARMGLTEHTDRSAPYVPLTASGKTSLADLKERRKSLTSNALKKLTSRAESGVMAGKDRKDAISSIMGRGTLQKGLKGKSRRGKALSSLAKEATKQERTGSRSIRGAGLRQKGPGGAYVTGMKKGKRDVDRITDEAAKKKALKMGLSGVTKSTSPEKAKKIYTAARKKSSSKAAEKFTGKRAKAKQFRSKVIDQIQNITSRGGNPLKNKRIKKLVDNKNIKISKTEVPAREKITKRGDGATVIGKGTGKKTKWNVSVLKTPEEAAKSAARSKRRKVKSKRKKKGKKKKK